MTTSINPATPDLAALIAAAGTATDDLIMARLRPVHDALVAQQGALVALRDFVDELPAQWRAEAVAAHNAAAASYNAAGAAYTAARAGTGAPAAAVAATNASGEAVAHAEAAAVRAEAAAVRAEAAAVRAEAAAVRAEAAAGIRPAPVAAVPVAAVPVAAVPVAAVRNDMTPVLAALGMTLLVFGAYLVAAIFAGTWAVDGQFAWPAFAGLATYLIARAIRE